MSYHYSQDPNVQNIIALLKAHGIKKMVVSPGTTNVCLIASAQYDGEFEMYSCIDERSAAYMAVGLAAESGEPVVITCTEATASRNYYPALTEANHRKLPILAITGMHGYNCIGNLEPQVIDRSVSPHDTFIYKVHLPVIKDEEDTKESAFLINKAILELTHHGGGPVHINMPVPNKFDFSAKQLPAVRVIQRYTYGDEYPEIQDGKIAIYCGAHMKWSDNLIQEVEQFCSAYNAVVFASAICGYNGKYRVNAPLLAASRYREEIFKDIDILINIGQEPDDYTTRDILAKRVREVWRVSSDGIVRDMFGKLTNIFEMGEGHFFHIYNEKESSGGNLYLNKCISSIEAVNKELPEIPFSNLYIASRIECNLPTGSVLHIGLSNTLRAWTMFNAPDSVSVNANIGCRGIDGCVSTLVGASLVNKNKLYFGVVGDLTFFYDMNVLGNRHLGANVRLLLVNNGGGNLFRRTDYSKLYLGLEETNKYIAAAGHFGDKSEVLVKNYAENLGFYYISAKDKAEFEEACITFLAPQITDKPILFEAFTDDENEEKAFSEYGNLSADDLKKFVKGILGEDGVGTVKKILKR